MPSTNAGSFNVTRQVTTMHPDGSLQINLLYTNAATGAPVSSRTLYVPAAAAQPITDQLGNVVNANVPAALANAIAAFAAQLDTTIGNGAAAGKLPL